MKMKLFALMCALTCAGAVQACDGVQALGAGCYAQNVQRVVIEKQVQPQYQIVERIVEPVYVQRVEKVRVVQRQKVQRVRVQRQKVVRQRIVERSVY
jgi:hypothetical protein